MERFYTVHQLRFVKLGLDLLSIALAWATFRFIERPIRHGGHSRRLSIILLAAMVTVAGLGLSAWQMDGHFLGKQDSERVRINAEQISWSDSANAKCRSETAITGEFCMLYGNASNIELAILGDSTGNHLAPGMGRLFGNSQQGVIDLGEGTCPPIRGLVRTAHWGGEGALLAPGCPRTVEREYAYVMGNPHIRRVVLAFFAHDFVNWGVPGADQVTE